MRLLKIKRAVDRFFGQLIDHRLLFSFQFASPMLAGEVCDAFRSADIVVSTSPPWAIHLAAWIATRRFRKLWLADYRDQFSGNHIQKGSALSRPIERMIDRALLRAADCVTVISSPMKTYYEQFHSRVECIENGYDDVVFEQARQRLSREGEGGVAEVTIRYLGSISADRIPRALLKAVADVNRVSEKKIRVEFFGESALLREMLPLLLPEAPDFVVFMPQLTYGDALTSMLSADLLYFVETSDLSSLSARGVLTTKLFEYLAAKKPVVAEISEDSLPADYLKRSGLALVISTEAEKIRDALLQYLNGEDKRVPDEEFIHSLSRNVKAQQMEMLLKDICKKD